jgi:hypothetical protein
MAHRSQALAEKLQEAGVVDTHYHVGPELIVRRYDVQSLADVAAPFGATLVLKNHTYPTTPLAALARRRFGARFFGGVVLNAYVGGLNPKAVEGAVSGNRAQVDNPKYDPSPVVVWMPTVHAKAHLDHYGFGFDPNWAGCCDHGTETKSSAEVDPEAPVIAFDDALRPTPELLATLEAIVRHGCILATGHLGAEEVKRLVPLALDMGVKRVILTHPHHFPIGLTDSDQKVLARRPEVFLEHCFATHTQDGVPLAMYADGIRSTGPEQVLLSTDFGQVSSDPFPVGTIRYAEILSELLVGFVSEAELIAMFSANGRRALMLET